MKITASDELRHHIRVFENQVEVLQRRIAEVPSKGRPSNDEATVAKLLSHIQSLRRQLRDFDEKATA